MKKIFSIFAIATTIAFTACDDHIDVPERTTKASHVVCESGKVIPYESLTPSDPPIAVVFYVNRGEDIPVTLEYLENNEIKVKYTGKAKSVTPGQACVLYKDSECLGCGFIKEVYKNNARLWYL